MYFHERALRFPQRCSQGHSAASGGHQFFPRGCQQRFRATLLGWSTDYHRSSWLLTTILNLLGIMVVGSTFYPLLARTSERVGKTRIRVVADDPSSDSWAESGCVGLEGGTVKYVC